MSKFDVVKSVGVKGYPARPDYQYRLKLKSALLVFTTYSEFEASTPVSTEQNRLVYRYIMTRPLL